MLTTVRRPVAAIAVLLTLAAATLVLSNTGTTEAQQRPTFTLPPQAREVAPNVFSLGHVRVNGRTLEGIAYVHTRPGAQPAKPPWAGGGKKGGSGPEACFSFTKGRYWKSTESYLFDPANSHGLSLALADLDGALNAWDGEVAADIFGSGALGSGLSADTSSPDAQNEALFASISDPGVIAVTITWFFNGPPFAREIVEWDLVFDDDAEWNWNTNGAAGAMDFLNIAVHEAGHAAGMGHTDTSATCETQTMYPFARFGETQKRDLDVGDQAGIKALYN